MARRRISEPGVLEPGVWERDDEDEDEDDEVWSLVCGRTTATTQNFGASFFGAWGMRESTDDGEDAEFLSRESWSLGWWLLTMCTRYTSHHGWAGDGRTMTMTKKSGAWGVRRGMMMMMMMMMIFGAWSFGVLEFGEWMMTMCTR